MTRLTIGIAVAMATLLAACACLAQPVRVMPVASEAYPLGGGPLGFALVGDTLYFDFSDGRGSGRMALWKSDGTADGTVLVKDVVPNFLTGPTASSGGKLFFEAAIPGQPATSGIWVSDGTFLGTRLLVATTERVMEMRVVNGTVYAVDGHRLYATDGTPGGTRIVSQHVSAPSNLVELGGMLFYWIAGNNSAGPSLWRADGAGGAILLKAFSPYFWSWAIVHQGKLFFGADDGTGFALWASDGTPAGTRRVVASGGPINPGAFASIGPHLYFNATDGASGRELWRSDGTAAGTVMIANIDGGPGDSIPMGFTAVGNSVVFRAQTPTLGQEVWKTDGTAAGTALVKDIAPGIFFGHAADSYPNQFVRANGAVCFVTGLSVGDLWRTDGTEAGTIRLMEDIDSSFVELVSTGTRVYFAKRVGTTGLQIWTSDCNSPAGNVLVKDIHVGVSNYSTVFNSLTAMGDHLLVRASTPASGQELWRVDASGGALLKDIEPGPGSGLEYVGPPADSIEPTPPAYGPYVRAGNTFYFRAVTSALGGELWKSDGTPAGTVLVKDIVPGPKPSTYAFQSYPDQLTASGGLVYFVADDGVNGKELWKSDGTEAGTTLLTAIVPEAWYGPQVLTDVNGTLYFSANDGVNGAELWKSDGTSAGTVMVKDLVPGSGSSYAYPIADFGGTLMFASGTNLWKSDGSAAGTVLVKAIEPPGTSSGLGLGVVMNGVLYFTVSANGPNIPAAQLWRSDGTEAGTYRVSTATGGYAGQLAAIGNALYFWSGDFDSGAVWKSDGTEAGTLLLAQVGRQNLVTPYGKFVALNGIVYFLGSDNYSGSTLWRTDGTPGGTFRLDLFPGFKGSNPAELTVMGDRLYFIANDRVNPRSLYYYVPRAAELEVTRLGNISSRASVLGGENVMIGGFVIGGAVPKTVMVRARGPSLAQAGVPNVLSNPQIQLFSGQAQIASNDDWADAPNAPAIQASGFMPTDAREAAILMQLAPGAYTAIVTGAGGTTGTAIVEVFEVGELATPLLNISTRALVQAGDGVMIGGFVIQGSAPQKVVVRARGPSMAAAGVANTLANPQLQLFSGSTQIAFNDNWMDAANVAEVEGSGKAPDHALESAILVTLQPGAYTAIVSGVAGTSGIAIVEVFRVD